MPPLPGEPGFVEALFLSRHADVTAVLADEARFSADGIGTSANTPS